MSEKQPSGFQRTSYLMDALRPLLDGRKGTTVAHYTSPDGFAGIIKSGEIRATDARFVNDIAEIQTGWDAAIHLIETRIPNATGASGELWSACALGADYVSKTSKVFIASFSENADDLSQWRAYCPNGGYSIAFAIARTLQPAALGVGALLVPCLYEESLRLKCLDRLLSSWSAHFTGAALNHPHKDYGELITEVAAHIMTDLAILAVFFKHEAFAAEHEVRLVLVEPEPSAPRILIQHRVVGAELIPYVAIPLESEDSPMILEHVIVAPGNNADAAAAAAKSLLAGLPREVGVELSKIPYRARH